MKKTLEIKLVKLYLWLALAYFFMGVITTLGKYPDRFFAVIVNNLWGVAYLTVVNFILFEYTIPFIIKKRKFLAYNVLIGLFLLWIHAMFYSYGAYAWRSLGLQLHIFTALKNYESLNLLLQNQMGYSTASVFLFAVLRHIYSYLKLKQAAQQLRIEKQEAELNYLQTTINRQ